MSHPDIKDITVAEIKRVLDSRELKYDKGMKKQQLYDILINGNEKKVSILDQYEFGKLTIPKIKKLLKQFNVSKLTGLKKDALYTLLQPHLYKLIPKKIIGRGDIDEMYNFLFKEGSKELITSTGKLKCINKYLEKFNLRYYTSKLIIVSTIYPPLDKLVFEDTYMYTLTNLRSILHCFDAEMKLEGKSREELIDEINQYYEDRYVKKLIIGSILLNPEVSETETSIYYGNRRFYKRINQ